MIHEVPFEHADAVEVGTISRRELRAGQLADILGRLGVTDRPEDEQRAAVTSAASEGRFTGVEQLILGDVGWLPVP